MISWGKAKDLSTTMKEKLSLPMDIFMTDGKNTFMTRRGTGNCIG